MAKIFAILIVSLMIGASLAQTPEDKWAQFKGRNGKLYKDKNEETRSYTLKLMRLPRSTDYFISF